MAQRNNRGGKPGNARKAPVQAPAVAKTAVAAVEVAKLAAEAPVPAAPAPVAPVAAKPVVAAPLAAEPVAAEPAKTSAPIAAPVATKIETVKEGASIMTETITNTVNQAQEATQQAAQQTAEQFRGAMNQANEQGKVAMEKGARFAEEMADITRGNLEAVVASQKTAAKYVETLTQGAADYSRRSFEEASATLRSFAEAKSPTDIFRLQSDFARSAFDALIAESARVSETVVKMSSDVAQPITNRYSVAAERLKAVAA